MGKVVPYGQKFNRRTKQYEDITARKPQFEFSYPEGFGLVIDTREQTPLFLPKPPKGLVIVRNTLLVADYSILGFERTVGVERKGIDDLWTSVTVESERFQRELVTLAEYELKYLLIEGIESEYLCHRPERKISPNSIRMALCKIEACLRIPIHSSETRADAERWLLDVFIRYFRMKRGL